MAQAETTSYQRLREHLACLRLSSAAEHLSLELDRALMERLSAPRSWSGSSSWRSRRPGPRTAVAGTTRTKRTKSSTSAE